MLTDLYNQVQKTSTTAYTDQSTIRENEAKERAELKAKKEEATEKAVDILYEQLEKEGFRDALQSKSEKGYFEHLIFKVSLDPGVDHLATHKPGMPYMEVEHEGVTHRITYRSLFWCAKWKTKFHPFTVRYRWNRARNLLSVYLSWTTR